jgi:hypothetical protein
MRKDHVIRLRLSEADRIAIQDAAANAGLGVSEFLRRCALGRRLLVDEDLATIRALREIAEAIRTRAVGTESDVVMERIRSEIEAQAARIERERQEKTG